MALLGIFADVMPRRIVETFSLVSGTCTSISSRIWNLRQKAHNVFRSFLLSSLHWLEAGAQKTHMMNEVEKWDFTNYNVFGTETSEAYELACMISALRARVLLEREKVRRKNKGETINSFSRIHTIFISTLTWLEKGQESVPLQESVRKIDEKITAMWKTKTEAYAALESQTAETASEAKMTRGSPSQPSEELSEL